MQPHRKAIIVLFCIAVALSACGPKNVRAPVAWNLTSEQLARGVYEKLTAFLKTAQGNHPECSADRPGAKLGICPALHSGITVQNRLADGINIYCSGVPVGSDQRYAAGGPCSPVLGAEPTLQGIVGEGLNFLAQYAATLGGGK